MLQIGAAAGVSLALVRKARVAMWTAIGVALLVLHGTSVRAAADQARVVANRSETLP